MRPLLSRWHQEIGSGSIVSGVYCLVAFLLFALGCLL
jgi:hypothetical protein